MAIRESSEFQVSFIDELCLTFHCHQLPIATWLPIATGFPLASNCHWLSTGFQLPLAFHWLPIATGFPLSSNCHWLSTGFQLPLALASVSLIKIKIGFSR